MTRTLFDLVCASLLLAACGSDTDTSAATGSGGSSSGTGSPSSSATSGSGGSGTTSSTTAGPGGSGSGGTGPAGSGGAGQGGAGVGGGTGDGACTNAADEAIIAMGGISDKISKCAQDNLGQEPGTKNCIKMSTMLSDGCVTCFDDTVKCTVMNCLAQCAGGQSPSCQMCMDMNCTPAFEACSGVN